MIRCFACEWNKHVDSAGPAVGMGFAIAFGTEALLEKTRRSATVTAVTKVEARAFAVVSCSTSGVMDLSHPSDMGKHLEGCEIQGVWLGKPKEVDQEEQPGTQRSQVLFLKRAAFERMPGDLRFGKFVSSKESRKIY